MDRNLGIKCDGKAYHSSKVARDRDRLHQQVFEDLGGKFIEYGHKSGPKSGNLKLIVLKNI